jgi:hypothetical protein
VIRRLLYFGGTEFALGLTPSRRVSPAEASSDISRGRYPAFHSLRSLHAGLSYTALATRRAQSRRATKAWQRAGALTIETVLGLQGKQGLHLFVVSTSDLGHNCCYWNSAARRTGSRPRDRVSPAKAGSDIWGALPSIPLASLAPYWAKLCRPRHSPRAKPARDESVAAGWSINDSNNPGYLTEQHLHSSLRRGVRAHALATECRRLKPAPIFLGGATQHSARFARSILG